MFFFRKLLRLLKEKHHKHCGRLGPWGRILHLPLSGYHVPKTREPGERKVRPFEIKDTLRFNHEAGKVEACPLLMQTEKKTNHVCFSKIPGAIINGRNTRPPENNPNDKAIP